MQLQSMYGLYLTAHGTRSNRDAPEQGTVEIVSGSCNSGDPLSAPDLWGLPGPFLFGVLSYIFIGHIPRKVGHP